MTQEKKAVFILAQVLMRLLSIWAKINAYLTDAYRCSQLPTTYFFA
jgi:hypothetical protein